MNFLEEIINTKKQEIKNLLKQEIQFPEIRKNYRFRARLKSKKKSLKIIAEFKKASPSAGIINETATISDIIPLYNKYADCISILTDEKFFSGDFEFISQAKKFTSLPILAKDFYLHPMQIIKAINYGADAILIIVRILSIEEIRELYKTADKYGIDAIVEVHSLKDLEKAFKAITPVIIGINTRDLETFEINKTQIFKILPQIPDGVITIAESGIKTPDEVKDLKGKVDGILIGTSLMKSKNPEEFLIELKKWCE